MTTRSLKLAQIARSIPAAQACGVVAVMTRAEHYTREHDRMRAVMG